MSRVYTHRDVPLPDTWDECGWQKAEWDAPDPPCCSWCGVRVSRRNYEIREGGESA